MNDSRGAWEKAMTRYTIKGNFANGPDLPLVPKLDTGFANKNAQ